MTITESRLKEGVLKLGTAPDELDISCQITNARITASYSDDGDAVETLCGDKLAAGEKADGYTLAGTFIQDWTATADSIIWYLWDHNLEEVAFTYTPNPAGDSLTGMLRLKLPAEFLGGDVGVRITSDFEWTITTEPTRVPPTGGTTATTRATTSTPVGSPV